MKIKIIALVLAVGAMLSGCAAVDAVADLFSPMPAYTTAPAEVRGEQYYYYNQLTEPEQMLYACLLAEAEKGADRCIMAKTDYDAVSECMARTVDAFLRDMPELYMFNGGATSSGEGGLGKNRDVTTVRLWKNEAFAGTEAEADAFSFVYSFRSVSPS